jgi:hypothetical protein
MEWLTTDNYQDQDLPTLGEPNITEETKVRNWMSYWGNKIKDNWEKSRKSLGGEGFSNDFIAPKAVNSSSIVMLKNIFYGVGTDNANTFSLLDPPFSDFLSFLEFSINLPFSNAWIDFIGSVSVYSDNPSYQAYNFILERSTEADFSLNNVIIAKTPTENFFLLEIHGKNNENNGFQDHVNFGLVFTDKDIKASGTYYYRLSYKSVTGGKNFYVEKDRGFIKYQIQQQ